MKVLLTGAAGFIGSAVWEWLNSRGHEVVPVDIAAPGQSPIVQERFRLRGLDENNLILTDAAHLSPSLVDSVEAAICLAGLGGSRGRDISLYHERNVASLVGVLEGVSDRKVPVLFASSSSIYGSAPVPHREDATPEPLHLYAGSKLAAESLARGWSQVNAGSPCIAMRFFTVYGPGQRPDMMFSKLLNHRTVPLYGGGHHLRSFSYIDDVVSAVGRLATEVSLPDGFAAVNVGSPVNHSLNHAIDILRNLGYRLADVRPTEMAVAEPTATQATDEVLTSLLGVAPEWRSLLDGLIAQAAWSTGASGE